MPRPLELCGHDCGSRGGFDRGFAAEDGSRDERDDKADGQGLDECVGHIDEGVLVELLRALDGSDPRDGGSGVKSRGLDLVNLRGEVAVHEVGHEVEVDDLPNGDVADAGDEGDQEAAGEGAGKGDLAGEGVVAVAADAEVDQQERRHHDGVAESHAVAGADLVSEQKGAVHQNRHDEAGDEAEGENDFLHGRLLAHTRMESRCGVTGPDVVILSDDFAGMEEKSCFRGTRLCALALMAEKASGTSTLVDCNRSKNKLCFVSGHDFRGCGKTPPEGHGFSRATLDDRQ
jgi:hypothetical protein